MKMCWFVIFREIEFSFVLGRQMHFVYLGSFSHISSGKRRCAFCFGLTMMIHFVWIEWFETFHSSKLKIVSFQPCLHVCLDMKIKSLYFQADWWEGGKTSPYFKVNIGFFVFSSLVLLCYDLVDQYRPSRVIKNVNNLSIAPPAPFKQ